MAEEGSAGPQHVLAAEHFDAFYRREYRPIVALTYVLCGSRTVAEDLAQDALTAAFRDWDRISSMQNPAGYVRRTAANLAVSTVRRRFAEAAAILRQAGRRQLEPELAEPDEEFWAAVRKLPRRQAQVVALRYVYGSPVREVAELLGMSEGAVKAHLFRARTSLCRLLDLHDDTSRSESLA